MGGFFWGKFHFMEYIFPCFAHSNNWKQLYFNGFEAHLTECLSRVLFLFFFKKIIEMWITFIIVFFYLNFTHKIKCSKEKEKSGLTYYYREHNFCKEYCIGQFEWLYWCNIEGLFDLLLSFSIDFFVHCFY